MTFTLALSITIVVGVLLFVAVVAGVAQSTGSIAETLFVVLALVFIVGVMVAGSVAMGMMWESVER